MPHALRDSFTLASDDMIRDAILSDCGAYRYELTRIWDGNLPLCGWIMLNPSTADHRQDDPTIRRCMSFARTWGYGGIIVGNVYAYRATDPKEMLAAADPVGPKNYMRVRDIAQCTDICIAAWGTLGGLKAHQLWSRLREEGHAMHCLGTTKDGHPRHPLYVKGDTKPELWEPPRQKFVKPCRYEGDAA